MSDDARPVRGIVFAHGDMAQGLVDAVRKISGTHGDALTALSNDGKRPEQLVTELREALGDDDAVIFTDLQAGSCATCALAASGRGRIAVLCGANLPMLLDFVFHRGLPLDELADRLVERGREAVRRLRFPAGEGPGGA